MYLLTEVIGRGSRICISHSGYLQSITSRLGFQLDSEIDPAYRTLHLGLDTFTIYFIWDLVSGLTKFREQFLKMSYYVRAGRKINDIQRRDK